MMLGRVGYAVVKGAKTFLTIIIITILVIIIDANISPDHMTLNLLTSPNLDLTS